MKQFKLLSTRIKKNSSPKNLKILRLILHSNHRKMGHANNSLKGPGFWKHLKFSFSRSLPDYQTRISAIIDDCLREKPDIVIFPACTAIWRYHAQLERYRREMKRLPCVAFGCLRVGQPRLREHSEIWAHGKRLMKFDARWPIAVKLAGIPAVVAQSSTIKIVYQFPPLILPADRAPANAPYKLALDLGHGQYSGRYIRALRTLKKMDMDTVLSFWRNQHGQTKYDWVESPRNHSLKRTELDHGDYMDKLVFF